MSPISISINNTSEAISNIETNPKFLYQYDGQSESSTKQVNTADGEEDGSKDYRDLLSTTSTSSQPVFKFVPEYEFSCIEYRQQSSQRDVADTETLSLYETTFSRTELDECSHFSYIVPVLILLLKIRAFDGALMGQEITVNQSHLQISSNGESILGDSTVKPAFVFAECLYPKYYAEAAKNQHADSRFFAGEKFPQDYVVNNLALILKEWSMFCSENNVHEWWLSHGNLLGWFWNRKLLPWDDDNDVQVTLYGLGQLWGLNGTKFHNRFLLDVNPYSINRNHRVDRNNVIDARFIDMKTGNFIDITALTMSLERVGGRRGRDGKIRNIACKSPHYYSYEELFPLRRTYYEGFPVNRPNKPLTYLIYEYSERGINSKVYKKNHFDEDLQEWIIDG